MSATRAELEEQARKLPPEERAAFAVALIESLREAPLAEVKAAWEREIEERVAAFDRGEHVAIPAEVVFAEARRLDR